ncbi:MAG TPA: shikimate dehydrogenase [Acidimicrobiales bacterium]|nr:shikimate dehydrogenase [Acidimicrobiales bacterium]
MNWRIGVVGSPIEHSLSPQLQMAGLKLAGLDGTSTRVELGLDGTDQLRVLATTKFDALSVTSPLKVVANEICDERSEVAKRTKSVNSLVQRDGKLLGESTDGPGFVNALSNEMGFALENIHAVILGAGGAASAIVDALVHQGVASAVVLARNEAKVDELTGRYQNVSSRSLVYRPVDLVVNTLPLVGRGEEAAVLQGVHHETVAVDLLYEPRMTPWRRLYMDAGCRSMNGLAMLAYQAALQMQWWWGVSLEGAKLLEVLQ